MKGGVELKQQSPCQTWKENSAEVKIGVFHKLVVELYVVFCACAGTVVFIQVLEISSSL